MQRSLVHQYRQSAVGREAADGLFVWLPPRLGHPTAFHVYPPDFLGGAEQHGLVAGKVLRARLPGEVAMPQRAQTHASARRQRIAERIDTVLGFGRRTGGIARWLSKAQRTEGQQKRRRQPTSNRGHGGPRRAEKGAIRIL